MPKPDAILTLSIGPSRVRFFVSHLQGEALAHAERSLPTGSSPADWWRAIRTGCKDVLRRAERDPERVRAVGICGTSDTIVCLDSTGVGTAPTSQLKTEELEAYATQVRQKCGKATLRNITGQEIIPHCMASQLLWAQEHSKRSWHDLQAALYAHDYVRFRLTGQVATDPASASHSRLFNTKQGIWSKQLGTKLGLNPRHLPTVQPANKLAGRVSIEAAKETGLPQGTPVVMGSNDLTCSAIGLGITGPGHALIELGGQGRCLITTAEPVRDPSKHLGQTRFGVQAQYSLSGHAMVTDAGLDWLAREIGLHRRAKGKKALLGLISDAAAGTPPAADGLFFIQPPHDGSVGSFLGLEYSHEHGHMARAVLESGALDLHGLLCGSNALPIPQPKTITVIGPGASCTLWPQILADAIGQEVAICDEEDLALIGCARLARQACGAVSSLDTDENPAACTTTRYSPRKSAVEAYTAAFEQRSVSAQHIASSTFGPHTAQ